MKKYLPFVFPAAAFLVVLFLAYRWYSLQSQLDGSVSSAAEGITIEDLTETERDNVLTGVGDFETVAMESQDPQAQGQVRYEIKDGKMNFSVMSGLPELTSGQYQVWLRDIDSQTERKAFKLEFSKGGYLGTAAVSAEVLPFEVVVSREETDDDQMETVLLQGKVKVEEVTE